MRDAPQSGFSRLILRISLRMSFDTGGRPGWPRRTFHVQNSRKPFAVPSYDGFRFDDAES